MHVIKHARAAARMLSYVRMHAQNVRLKAIRWTAPCLYACARSEPFVTLHLISVLIVIRRFLVW